MFAAFFIINTLPPPLSTGRCDWWRNCIFSDHHWTVPSLYLYFGTSGPKTDGLRPFYCIGDLLFSLLPVFLYQGSEKSDKSFLEPKSEERKIPSKTPSNNPSRRSFGIVGSIRCPAKRVKLRCALPQWGLLLICPDINERTVKVEEIIFMHSSISWIGSN